MSKSYLVLVYAQYYSYWEKFSTKEEALEYAQDEEEDAVEVYESTLLLSKPQKEEDKEND